MLHGSQHAAGLFAITLLGCFAAPAIVSGASVRSSANFTVVAPSDRLADMVVDHAEKFRSRIGAVWLGEPLPATRTTAVIFIKVDDTKSFARTLIDPLGDRHLVWLSGSEQAVTKYLLAHEVAHVTLASKFGAKMPIWANEGIASRYDNARRVTIRDRHLRGFVAIESWPELERLFEGPIRQPWQYAAAVSVTDFLVDRGGREKFIAFVADSATGIDTALAEHYGFSSIRDLQQEWQHAVRAEVAQTVAATATMASAPAPSSTRFVR